MLINQYEIPEINYYFPNLSHNKSIRNKKKTNYRTNTIFDIITVVKSQYTTSKMTCGINSISLYCLSDLFRKLHLPYEND